MKIDTAILQKKEFNMQEYIVLKWCEIEQGVNEGNSGVG